MSNKTMMTTISISKDSHLIPMMEMAQTHKTQWKKIQSFDCLSDILRGKLGLHSLTNLVTAMSNTIPTETAEAYEEARTPPKVVEGAVTKVEYLDDIGSERKRESYDVISKGGREAPGKIMYLKVLCNLNGHEIDEMVLQEPFKFQFCLKPPQSMRFPNGDIQPLSGSPRKGKSKKRAKGSFTGLLQDSSDDDKSMSVPSPPINHRRLGFDDDEGSDTGTCTGGEVGGSTSAAKDDGKAGTLQIERLIQSERTSDIPIISWFGDVYILDSTILFVKEMGKETPQRFATRPVIDSVATVCSDSKTYAEKCMFVLLQVELLPRGTNIKPVMSRLSQQRHNDLTC